MRSLLLSCLLLLALYSLCASSQSVTARRTACLRSCHTCQQMYGEHFEGYLCAHTCLRLKGRAAPDCANLASIAPYLDLDNLVR